MSLATGARLGPYEIVALLGAGGMGFTMATPAIDRDSLIVRTASTLYRIAAPASSQN